MSKICFIVGHGKSQNGGYDPGACSGGYQEFKIAKEIAKYAWEYLNANYSVHADLMNYDGALYLSDRIKNVNSADYDFIAEFHLNAGKGTGTETYYSRSSTQGKKFASAISANIAAALGIKNRGAKLKLNSSGTDYFGIIRQTEPCAVLIETAFIDTPSDLAKIKTEAGQKACGEAAAQAVASVMNLKTRADNSEKSPVIPTDSSFKVKVICSALNIRKGAGTFHKKTGQITDKGVYTIVETNKSETWGKLKSGVGWISLNSKYIKRINGG